MASEASGLSGLAERYANALFELADDAKALDQVADDLRTVRGMMTDSDDLRRLIRSPMIGREEQGRALERLLEAAGVSDLTRRFVAVVAANRRAFALPQMVKAFLEQLAARRGEVTAEVTSATELTAAQRAALSDHLKRLAGGRVTVHVTVDPALLGGLVVRLGSRMVDYSLSSKLSRLQLAMKGTG